MKMRVKMFARGVLEKVKMMNKGQYIPKVTFKTRVRDESIEGSNPFRWQDVTSEELWGQGRHVVFSLPGAFTPTCSTYQLPDFEKLIRDGEFAKYGIDSVSCISVNDAFVMNSWGRDQNVENVQLIPDGSGDFTRQMGMLVRKDNLGFGMRSWRYAMIICDGEIEEFIPEDPGYDTWDNCESDPYEYSSPQNVLKVLESMEVTGAPV